MPWLQRAAENCSADESQSWRTAWQQPPSRLCKPLLAPMSLRDKHKQLQLPELKELLLLQLLLITCGECCWGVVIVPRTELSPSLMDAHHKPCLALGGGSAETSFEHVWGAQAAARSGGSGGLEHGVGAVSGPAVAALRLQAKLRFLLQLARAKA